MKFPIHQKVGIEREVDGSDDYWYTLGGLRNAISEAGDIGFIATTQQLLQLKKEMEWNRYTANTENFIGIDQEGRVFQRDTPVVATLHGGIGAHGLITPEVAYKNGFRERIEKIDLDSAYKGEYTFRDFLRGVLPDWSSIGVLSYTELLHEGNPGELVPYVVVRPLAIARKESYPEKIMEEFHERDEKKYREFNDTDIIVFAGGVEPARQFLERWRVGKIGGQVINTMTTSLYPSSTPKNTEGYRIELYTYGGSLSFSGPTQINPRLVVMSEESIAQSKIKGRPAEPTLEEILAIAKDHSPEMNHSNLTKEMEKLYRRHFTLEKPN